jgi:hypothetical protein
VPNDPKKSIYFFAFVFFAFAFGASVGFSVSEIGCAPSRLARNRSNMVFV